MGSNIGPDDGKGKAINLENQAVLSQIIHRTSPVSISTRPGPAVFHQIFENMPLPPRARGSKANLGRLGVDLGYNLGTPRALR